MIKILSKSKYQNLLGEIYSLKSELIRRDDKISELKKQLSGDCVVNYRYCLECESAIKIKSPDGILVHCAKTVKCKEFERTKQP